MAQIHEKQECRKFMCSNKIYSNGEWKRALLKKKKELNNKGITDFENDPEYKHLSNCKLEEFDTKEDCKKLQGILPANPLSPVSPYCSKLFCSNKIYNMNDFNKILNNKKKEFSSTRSNLFNCYLQYPGGRVFKTKEYCDATYPASPSTMSPGINRQSSARKQSATKQTKCPKGTRRDKKTKRCEPTTKNASKKRSPVRNKSSSAKKQSATKQKRCPKGTRRDKKTKNCVPK
jgi:hypothetical protein